VKYSQLVDRIAGEGSDAWDIHYEAAAARERGEDVILLSVGDPDLDTPGPVLERAIERLRAGDTHYTPAPGRRAVRAAIAAAHRARTGQSVEVENVIYLSGTQNALFTASLCLAGPGDEVIAPLANGPVCRPCRQEEGRTVDPANPIPLTQREK
jgi:arginine:pyruvate transaminase